MKLLIRPVVGEICSEGVSVTFPSPVSFNWNGNSNSQRSWNWMKKLSVSQESTATVCQFYLCRAEDTVKWPWQCRAASYKSHHPLYLTLHLSSFFSSWRSSARSRCLHRSFSDISTPKRLFFSCLPECNNKAVVRAWHFRSWLARNRGFASGVWRGWWWKPPEFPKGWNVVVFHLRLATLENSLMRTG